MKKLDFINGKAYDIFYDYAGFSDPDDAQISGDDRETSDVYRVFESLNHYRKQGITTWQIQRKNS